jgi:hypothetical protein
MQLQQLHSDGLQLATRSLQLLSLQDPKEQQAYAATNRDAGSIELSCITCMAVIRQSADEVRRRVDRQEEGGHASAARSCVHATAAAACASAHGTCLAPWQMKGLGCCKCPAVVATCCAASQPDGVGQLVVGTEDSRILLLGPGCTSVTSSISLPAVPALISIAGGLDAGYRVTVAARDGWLYSIKAGALTKTVIQLDSQPVGLVSTSPCTVLFFPPTLCALHCSSWPQHSVVTSWFL